MAIFESKRSVRLKQAARRNDRRATNRHPDRGGSSEERRKQLRSTSRRTQQSAKSKPKNNKRKTGKRSSTPSPGEFGLREKTLPGRRFIEFPLVKGKIAEKVQLFTTTNHNSLAIEFQDQTSLQLDIEPGFVIHAQLMRLEKGELETLAEWPPIRNVTNR